MILIDRCKIMKENPPGDDWDGVSDDFLQVSSGYCRLYPK